MASYYIFNYQNYSLFTTSCGNLLFNIFYRLCTIGCFVSDYDVTTPASMTSHTPLL